MTITSHQEHFRSSAIGRTLNTSLSVVRALFEEWRARRQMRVSLGQLTDTQLRDIGLTSGDVRSVEGLTLDHSASDHLKAERKSRIGNF